MQYSLVGICRILEDYAISVLKAEEINLHDAGIIFSETW